MLPHTRERAAATTLNELIRTVRDSEERLLSAADRVDSTELKQILNDYSLERAKFVSRLQWEVGHLGAEPQASGSLAAAFRREMQGLRAALTGESDLSALITCERGEYSALQSYKRALRSELPTSARELVERQHARIAEGHTFLRKLRLGVEGRYRPSTG